MSRLLLSWRVPTVYMRAPSTGGRTHMQRQVMRLQSDNPKRKHSDRDEPSNDRAGPHLVSLPSLPPRAATHRM